MAWERVEVCLEGGEGVTGWRVGVQGVVHPADPSVPPPPFPHTTTHCAAITPAVLYCCTPLPPSPKSLPARQVPWWEVQWL